MEVEDAVTRLHVVRKFTDQPVAEADATAILNAGRRAGSSKNLQRWDFIVVRSRDTLVRLAEVGPYAGHIVGGAMAIALITPDPASGEPLSVMWDLGRAAQNMVLVAWSRGIGSCPATVYEQDLCREILGYPRDRHCEYILTFGHPAAEGTLTRPLRKGGRKSLQEMVYRERWDEPNDPRQS